MPINFASAKARYEYRKRKHRCVICGCKVTSGGVYCEKCSEKQKERYKARKESGLCTRCGKQSRPGKTMCAVCACRESERVMKFYQGHKDYWREYCKKRKERSDSECVKKPAETANG